MRWSLRYYNEDINLWVRSYYYSLKDFNIAREKLEEKSIESQEKFEI
jgi:hypothetical protein